MSPLRLRSAAALTAGALFAPPSSAPQELVAGALLAPPGPGQELATGALADDRAWEAIDLVVALDTSDSMGRLLDSARLKLWEIVNDLAGARPTPRLRLGLVSYGNHGHAASAGWVEVEAELTSDLDAVYERLFEMRASGGQELVGRALETAVEQLDWTASDESLKLLVIAGDEPADMDAETDLAAVTQLALERGIAVIPVFCGRPASADAESWRELAELVRSPLYLIDPRATAASVATPFDAELIALGQALNDTYVPIGEEGAARWQKLLDADANATRLGQSAAADRIVAKAGPLLGSDWDLVGQAGDDGLPRDDIELDGLARERLGGEPTDRAANRGAFSGEVSGGGAPRRQPSTGAEAHPLEPGQLAALLAERWQRRQEVGARIAELAVARDAYLEGHGGAGADASTATLDVVVRQALRERGEDHGFFFAD